MRNTSGTGTSHLIRCPPMPSYYALRVCSRADTPAWWSAARQDVAGAPPAIRAILAGRSRVEVSAAEAAEAIAWASGLTGWDSGSLPPLWVYPAATG
jgi:hypothetical protein